MFSTLDAMYKNSYKEEIPIVELPKKKEGKNNDMKIYKRNYYLQNIETYRERNHKAAVKKYKEDTLDWMLEQAILNGEE